MIRLEEVKTEDKIVLSNLLEKYQYEMSKYYFDEMNEDGNFGYKYLDAYFEGDDKRTPYFIYADDTRIGFVLVNNHSFTKKAVDNCIAEFTIFPCYRHKGLAMLTLAVLFEEREGIWQLKYSKLNKAGCEFWKKAASEYDGKEEDLGNDEVALTFEKV